MMKRVAKAVPLSFVGFLIAVSWSSVVALEEPDTSIEKRPDKFLTSADAVRVVAVEGTVLTDAVIETQGMGASKVFLDVAEHLEDVVSEPNCFLQDQDWVSSVEGYTWTRGWELPSASCSSSSAVKTVSKGGSKWRIDSDVWFERLQALGSVLYDTKDSAVVTVGNALEDRFFPGSFGYASKPFTTCTLERVTVLRVQKRAPDEKMGKPVWFILAGITNAAVDEDKPDRQREYLSEYIGVDPETRKFIQPLKQYLSPGWTNNVTERVPSYTAHERWGGRVGQSAVYSMGIAASPAVVLADRELAKDVGQAEDALTASNIAILAIPMFANLIPVPIFSGWFLLAEIVLTDIVPTAPFIFKGMELIMMGKRRPVFEDTWFRGRTEDALIVVESWAAQCELKGVQRTGAIFVSVGCFIMAVGILLDIWGERQYMKWKARGTLRAGTRQNVLASIKNKQLHEVGTVTFETRGPLLGDMS